MTSPVQIIGHAGAAGFHPCNSAESINKAIELGVDRIEIDVLSTSEGVLVLVHDRKLLIEGKKNPIASLALEQLRSIIPGTLTLEDAANLTDGRIPLLIDIKGRHYVNPLIDAIRSMGHDSRVSASSTHARVLKQLHMTFPEMSLGLSRGHSLTRVPSERGRSLLGAALSLGQVIPTIAVAKWCGARDLMIQHHICTWALVAAAHRAGLHVNAWTVDQPIDIRRVIAAGVDGVISNRPDLVFDELVNRE